MSIGTALRDWRTAQEITQTEAASRAHVSQATWCDWEGDKKIPSGDKAFDLEELTAGAVTARECAEAVREGRKAREKTADPEAVSDGAPAPTGTEGHR